MDFENLVAHVMPVSIAVAELILLHPPREVLLEVSVPKEDTVHKEQRHLSHALWGNTVEPKEIRNLMTALPVILDTTVQVILTPNQLARAPLDIIALVGHLHQPSLSHPKVTFLVRQLLRPSNALWELTKRVIVLSGALIALRRISVMKWG